MGNVDKIESLVEDWVMAQESAHTRTAYRRDVLSGVDRMKIPGWVPWCEQRDLEPLSARRRDVDTYKQALKSAGYSPASIARRLSAVSSWYDYLLDVRAVDDNPAKSVKRPRVDLTVSNAVGLSEDELNALLNTATEDGTRSAALLALLFFGGGLRVGSICGANIGDLGWNEGVRTIKLTVKGGEVIRESLDEMAVGALDAYLEERGKAAKGDPLFVTVRGKRFDQSTVWREVRRLAKVAQIPSWSQLSPHSLRHTFATHALDEGASLVDLQDQMRHRSMDTTRRYDRARGKRDRQPSKLLGERRRRYLAEQAESLREAEPLPHDRMEP